MQSHSTEQHDHHGHGAASDPEPAARGTAEEPTAATVHGHPQLAHADHAGHPMPAGMPHGGDHGGGHRGGHAGHGEAMFRRPFRISLILTIPILIYAPLLQELLHYSAPPFPGAA